MKPTTDMMLWIALAVTLGACDATSQHSSSTTLDGDYRFAAEPAGLDSPAAACVVCHSVEKGGPLRVAPTLWGIVGAKKARYSGWYGYSQALAKAGGYWTPKDLNAYLEDPDGFLPGTSKTLIGISDPDERADLIAYLESLNNQ